MSDLQADLRQQRRDRAVIINALKIVEQVKKTQEEVQKRLTVLIDLVYLLSVLLIILLIFIIVTNYWKKNNQKRTIKECAHRWANFEIRETYDQDNM